MNRDQAYALVDQTFRHAFDKNRFSNFTRNLLNHIDESKAGSWNSQYVKDAFKEHVRRYERLGTYTSPEKEKLDLLIVHLTHESKLERARTAIRNFVADHLKTRDEKDAALVAFVSPSESTWRFSYVRMEYATVEKESGKVGVETHLTPARRFSYIVGEGESCHTAQSRFLDLLQDTETDPTLAQIEEAFSVEAVTKEFFTKYADLFGMIHKALDKLATKDENVREEFRTKGVNTVDFAKKLMGQIVFLYFLQKKGWLGVAKGQNWGDGPRDFLRRMANGEFGKYENFFNDILEPLFYDTLATDRGHEAWCSRFKCRIPFLNGGLFEPLGNYDWRKTNILLPNKLFTNSEFVDEGIEGTGVLDVFDRYNFTVNEADPLETEVAIDPEMLGKVFENLIEENLRKGLGAYYTPREIVHYMCQESLINYLDTALNTQRRPILPKNPKQTKLLGEPEPEQPVLTAPAYQEIVPRADIETLVHLGEQISHYESVDAEYSITMPKSIAQRARFIDETLAAITVCDPAVGSGAFPVGMMTEVVRSRCALTPYFNDVHERTPYHFKRHAIQNCLYGVDIDPGAVDIAKLRLWLSLVVDEEDVKQIKPLPNLDYKIVVGNSLLGVETTLFNVEIVNRLEALKPLYFDESDKATKATYRREIDQLIHRLTNNKELFDFAIYFSEVFHKSKGFDVLIANPPYVGEKGHKDMFQGVASGPLKHFYQGKMDLFYFFFHLALNLVRNHGHVAFITTNYYLTATGAKKLRSDFKNRAVMHNLMNFNELKIFESALGQHNMITILEKGLAPDAIANNCITRRQGFASPEILRHILLTSDTETDYYRVRNSGLYSEGEAYIRLMGDTAIAGDPISAVLNRMKSDGAPLGTLCNINCGIQTGCDRIKTDDGNSRGVFVIDSSESRGIPSDEKSLLRPFYKNSDIRKFFCSTKTDLRVIYTDRQFNRPSQFPVIMRHLAKSRNRLENIREVRKGIIQYYQLQWPREESIFRSPKIVAPQRSRGNTFAYTEREWYASVDVYFITKKDAGVSLKYILAILNSKLYFLWLYREGKRKGETLELYQKPLSEIPIRRVSEAQQKPFVDLADRILVAKNCDPEADTIALEREIDHLVYKLYDLQPDEIAIVEESAPAR